MKTRKTTRTAARDGVSRATSTVKRAAKKAVAKVTKAARTVKKAASKKLGGRKTTAARKGAGARGLPAP